MIKVVTWNILHPDYALSDRYKIKPAHLTWEHRKPLIEKELIHTNADVICLQEVSHDSYPEMKGYEVILNINKKRKKEIEKAERPLLVATYYKSERFTLVSTLHSSRTLTVSLKQNDDKVWIIQNVHLPVEVKEQLNHLKGLKGKKRIDILCGDFNNFPDSDTIEFVKSQNFQISKPQPKSTYYKEDIIDFIFTAPEYYTDQYWGRARKIPSEEWPSDHIWISALISQMRLKRGM